MNKEILYMDYLISLIKEDYKNSWSDGCDWVYTCHSELIRQKQWMEEEPSSGVNGLICKEFYNDIRNNKSWSKILKVDTTDIISFDDYSL